MTQLLSVIHEIQTTFDNNPSFDEGGIFLDIGVEGELHLPLKNRENRAQRVFFNGQTYLRRKISSRISRDLVLGPLLFLI